MLASKKNAASGQARKPSEGGATRRATCAFAGVAAAMEDGSYSLKAKMLTMKEDLARSQESFISRERAYKTRISELEDEFARIKTRKTGWMRSSGPLNELKEVHASINRNVDLLQGRTAQIVSAQEAYMVKTFRGRLYEIQVELDKEKGKIDDGSLGWIDRGHALERQVEALKEASDLLERLNQGLAEENAKLVSIIGGHSGDRGSLLVSLSQEQERHTELKDQVLAARQTRAGLLEQVWPVMPSRAPPCLTK